MDGLGKLGIGIAVLCIVLTIAFLVIDTAETQAGNIEDLDFNNVTECANSSTCNATKELTEAIDEVPGWVPIVVITAIGAVLLGLVQTFRRK